jgi:hypothetical protein
MFDEKTNYVKPTSLAAARSLLLKIESAGYRVYVIPKDNRLIFNVRLPHHLDRVDDMTREILRENKAWIMLAVWDRDSKKKIAKRPV